MNFSDFGSHFLFINRFNPRGSLFRRSLVTCDSVGSAALVALHVNLRRESIKEERAGLLNIDCALYSPSHSYVERR